MTEFNFNDLDQGLLEKFDLDSLVVGLIPEILTAPESPERAPLASFLIRLGNDFFCFRSPICVTVTEFVQSALQFKSIKETDRYTLFYDGHVRTSGTLQDLDINDGARLCIVENTEVSANISWYDQPHRKRIFRLTVRKTDTALQIKKNLIEAIQKGYPPCELIEQDLLISKGHNVFSDESYPMMGAIAFNSLQAVEEEDTEFTVHVIPNREERIPLKLTYKKENDDGDSEWIKELVFVSKNGTVGQMRDEIAKIVSSPSSSLKIAVQDRNNGRLHFRSANDRGLERDDDSDSDSDESRTYVAPCRRWKKLHLPLETKISDYPDMFEEWCVLRVKPCPCISLAVKVTRDNNKVMTILSLKVNRFDTMDLVFRMIATTLNEDSRQIKRTCPSKSATEERTVEDYLLKGESMLAIHIYSKGVSVALCHCDGLFEDTKFVTDSNSTTIQELQNFVEKKHRLSVDSVRLYRNDRMLDAKSTVSDVGVKMGESVIVRTRLETDFHAYSDGKHAAIASNSACNDNSTSVTTAFGLKDKTSIHEPSTPALQSRKRKPCPGGLNSVRKEQQASVSAETALNKEMCSNIVSANAIVPKERASQRTKATNTLKRLKFKYQNKSKKHVSQTTRCVETVNRCREIQTFGSALNGAPLAAHDPDRPSQVNIPHQCMAFLSGLLSHYTDLRIPTTAHFEGQAVSSAALVVEDSLLRRIAEGLGNDWASVCLELGVASEDLDRIKHNQHDLWDQAYAGLKRWKMAKASQATHQALEMALRAKNLNLLANMIHVNVSESLAMDHLGPS